MANLPPIAEQPLGGDGRWSARWYLYWEQIQDEQNSLTVSVDGVATTLSDFTADKGLVTAAFGTSRRVAVITPTADGRIASISQVDIAFPVTPQTGWSAPATLTVSNPPTQAEMQAIEARQRATITALIASGLLTA